MRLHTCTHKSEKVVFCFAQIRGHANDIFAQLDLIFPSVGGERSNKAEKTMCCLRFSKFDRHVCEIYISVLVFQQWDLLACSDNALRHNTCTHALRHSTCMCCEHGTCLGWWWEMNHAYGICGRCIILVIHECTALVLPLWMFYDQGMHILCS